MRAECFPGELPYRDYFELLTSGSELVYAWLYKLFGVSLWIPNFVMACLAAATVLFMSLCARRLVRGPWVALPAVLFIGFVLYGSLDAMHHWFSTVVVLAAMLVLFQGTTFWRIAAVGALCGLAASFTQSKGAAAVLAFLIYIAFNSSGQRRDGWRKGLLLCGMAVLVFAAINGRLHPGRGSGPLDRFRDHFSDSLLSLRLYQ